MHRAKGPPKWGHKGMGSSSQIRLRRGAWGAWVGGGVLGGGAESRLGLLKKVAECDTAIPRKVILRWVISPLNMGVGMGMSGPELAALVEEVMESEAWPPAWAC